MATPIYLPGIAGNFVIMDYVRVPDGSVTVLVAMRPCMGLCVVGPAVAVRC